MEQIGYINCNQKLDAVFFALSDSTRRSILSRLKCGEASVTDLALPFAISQPAISKHLRILERAGLIKRTIAKQTRPASIDLIGIENAVLWLMEFKGSWDKNFANLDLLLLDLQRNPPDKKENQ